MLPIVEVSFMSLDRISIVYCRWCYCLTSVQFHTPAHQPNTHTHTHTQTHSHTTLNLKQFSLLSKMHQLCLKETLCRRTHTPLNVVFFQKETHSLHTHTKNIFKKPNFKVASNLGKKWKEGYTSEFEQKCFDTEYLILTFLFARVNSLQCFFFFFLFFKDVNIGWPNSGEGGW